MTEKKAMTASERAGIIKSVVAAAALSAGAGALFKGMKAKKSRAKRLDVENSRNAIVVPLKKSKFMEGLPTPSELAESRGETGSQSVPSVGIEQAPALPAPSVPEGAEVDAIKREILRDNARKVDFFGKRAEDNVTEKPDENGHEDDDVGEKDDSEKKRVVLRDQSGRFASPNDPAAVEQCDEYEKSAGFWDLVSGAAKTVISPIDSLNVALDAAKDRPVWLAGGAVGSIYLAKLIADEVNDIRKRKAKERADAGREAYVSLLQGSEKEAAEKEAEDPRAIAGTVMGTAFFVPMALAAIVTNKVIENRRDEKRRKKLESDTYPEEPVVLYKTSSDKTFRISPETALAAIEVKRGMILSSEGYYGEEKAASSDGQVKSALFGAFLFPGSNMSIDEAQDKVLSMMENPNNNRHLLSIVKAMHSGDNYAVDAAFKEMAKGADPSDMMRIYGSFLRDPAKKRQLMDSVKRSQRLQDLIVSRFEDDKYADSFGKYRNEIVNDRLSKTFKKDSILYRIISWISENLGLGKFMAKNSINTQFNKWRSEGAVEQAAQRAQSQQGPGNKYAGRIDNALRRFGGYIGQKGKDAAGYVTGKVSDAYKKSKLHDALNAPGGPVGWWYTKNHPEMFVRRNPVSPSGRFVSSPDVMSDEEISRLISGRNGK